MRLLVIPVLTKLAAASPFHCCLVSPGSKRAILTCPPNHVDKWSVSHPEMPFRDGRHTGLCKTAPFPDTLSVASFNRFRNPLLAGRHRSTVGASLNDHFLGG